MLTTGSLGAYYSFIHPCFPVLPPPSTDPSLDQPVQLVEESGIFPSKSPLLHAIAALVALVPKDDGGYDEVRARAARHEYAEHCSKLALKGIDCDIDTSGPLTRSRFHRDVPVHLESILATLLVAVHDYCYRGSLMRARTRMASAITMAMDSGLHDIGLERTRDSECQQRVWSMIVS